eukprot:3678456-Amphidinium_carterae.1
MENPKKHTTTTAHTTTTKAKKPKGREKDVASTVTIVDDTATRAIVCWWRGPTYNIDQPTVITSQPNDSMNQTKQQLP